MKTPRAIVTLAAAATLFTLIIPSGTLWATASKPKSSPRRTGSAATKGQSSSPPLVPIQNQRGIYVYSEHPENPTDFNQTMQAVSVKDNGVDGLTLLVGWNSVEPDSGVYQWDPPNGNAWSSSTSYVTGNEVSYGGEFYVSLSDGNLGRQPNVSPYWQATGATPTVPLDQLLNAAKTTGKKVDLAIRAGQDTPCWLFKSAQCGANYAKPYAGAEPHNFLVSPVGGVGQGGTCNPETIAAPWDTDFLTAWDSMLAAVAQHLNDTGTYDTVTSVRLTGINRTTTELRLPAEILLSPCADPSQTDRNSVAIWLAAGYRPSLLLTAWGQVTTSFKNSFPDKFFTLPIIPDNSGNADYPFPQIAENGDVYSPDPVPASSFSIPPGIPCSTCTTDPMPDDNAPMIALASEKFPGRLVVAYQSLINGNPAEPYIGTTAQTLGTMTGFQTNDFVGPFQSAACSGGSASAVACADSPSFLALLEIGIYPVCPAGPISPDSLCRTALRSQYIEILPPDANNPVYAQGIWQAHLELTDYTPPVTTAAASGLAGVNGWYRGPVVVNFNASDDLSGVATTEFSSNNGSTWINGNSLSLTNDGIYSILFRSTDVAGNIETPKSIIVMIDSKAPLITAIANPATIFNNVRVVEVTISGTMKDKLSGVDPSTAKFVVHDEYGRVQPTGPVTVDANGNYSFTISLRTFVRKNDTDGRLYTIKVGAADNAGNARSAEATVVAKTFKPPPPPPCTPQCV